MIAESVARARAYSSLVRLSHTIFALPFAASAVVLAMARPHIPLTLSRVLLLLLAMAAARTAAMAYNRYVDRDVDAENPRTAGREVPRGVVSAKEALLLALSAGATFLGVAAMLGTLTFVLALPVLAVLFGYSHTKRFTWASHIVLGLALALAPGGSWIAMGARPEPAIVALMVAVLTWVSGFDILYSLQDADFDRKHGLYSIPARFGTAGALITSIGLHLFTVLALALAGVWLARGIAYFVGVTLVTGLLAYEHALVGRGNLAKIDRAFFDINGYVSVGFFALTVVDALLL
jgi:4-hydroxybenzoate polyprenyltransferase